MKIGTIVKVANIAATLLGVAGTVLSGWAGQKAMQDSVAKEVAKAFAEQSRKH